MGADRPCRAVAHKPGGHKQVEKETWSTGASGFSELPFLAGKVREERREEGCPGSLSLWVETVLVS